MGYDMKLNMKLKLLLGFSALNMVVLPIAWFFSHCVTTLDKTMEQSFQEAALGTITFTSCVALIFFGVSLFVFVGDSLVKKEDRIYFFKDDKTKWESMNEKFRDRLE